MLQYLVPLLLAAFTLVATRGEAADTLIPGKLALVKPAALVKGVYKGTFPVPASVGGAFLNVFDTGTPSGGDDTYALTAGTWKGLGNPAGSKGWKYKGAGSPSDPCKVVLIKAAVIKHVCKGSGITLGPPLAGDLGVILGVGGGRYCAQFGGTLVKNDSNLFKRKNAPAPSACPTPGGSSSSSTTTTTSTSSTSTSDDHGSSSTSSSGGSTTSTSTTGGSTTTA